MKIGITQTFPQWVKIIYNPPYYQDATISKLAAATGFYKAKGNGVEALFLEWII